MEQPRVTRASQTTNLPGIPSPKPPFDTHATPPTIAEYSIELGEASNRAKPPLSPLTPLPPPRAVEGQRLA